MRGEQGICHPPQSFHNNQNLLKICPYRGGRTRGKGGIKDGVEGKNCRMGQPPAEAGKRAKQGLLLPGKLRKIP
jgi:hypothetical protein